MTTSTLNDPPELRAFKENERYEQLRRRYGRTAMLEAPFDLGLTPGDPKGDDTRPYPAGPHPSSAALNDWQRHTNNLERGTGYAGEDEWTTWDDIDLRAERYPELAAEEEFAD